MTGGNVVSATTPDIVEVDGRVASGGTKVAPASGAGKWTVTSGSTGVYTIVFAEAYPEFMGCQVTLEAASGVARVDSFTVATRTLVIKTFAVDGVTAVVKAFAFCAKFSENRAP
jgi:hypothetical protein